MFAAARTSQIRRIRSGGDSAHEKSTVDSVSPSPKRKAPTETSSTTSPNSQPSPRLSGDYQVLKEGVETHRCSLQETRFALANSLDRLGEHHVRQKEYDDAMDAFTEALHEKRSIISTMRIRTLSGGSSSFSSTIFDSEIDVTPELHDRTIDEIILTLRSMGNVHSLRGEQDEAMRYYTEVTNLKATKAARNDATDDTTTLFSGLGGDEDNSTLMSEINEDVKALDDMFRSISFRSRDSSSLWALTRKVPKPLGAAAENASNSSSNKRRKGDSLERTLSANESEPFRRSSSNGIPATGNELSEALEMYKNVLENYKGPNLENHKDSFNSLALRNDLLGDSFKRSDSVIAKKGENGPVDLELAVEIYQQIMTAQYEINATQQDIDSSHQSCSSLASTLIRMGSLYYKLGNRLEELRMYQEAKSIYKRAFGENHAFVAGTRKNIGMVLAERGEYDDAIAQFEKARRIYLAVNDDDEMNRDVASAISCMGNVKNRLGELDDALKHYMEALRIHKAIQDIAVDPESNSVAIRDVTSTLKVIGMVHAKMGDLDIAMTFFTEAMTLLRSSGVESTPSGQETTSSVLTRMASIHVKKGDLDQAMELYREAYEITVRNRGTTNHQEVAGILHYIGGIFHKRSDHDEAMNCYQEAIRIYHSTLGPGNPTVAGTLVMVGSIHYKRRNMDSAMMFYREALRLNRDAYGLHHPDVGPILKSIGTILTKKGGYHEAYDVFRDVLSIKCTVHGTGHPEVANAYKSLGNVHYKLGELADAERQYRHALSIYRRTKGEQHPDTIAARTTIEHIRYWMKERGQRKMDERHTKNSARASNTDDDERSC